MPKVFERDGLQFQYADNWQIESDDAGDGWAVTAASPATAFLMLTYVPGAIDPQPVVDEALETLREVYKELEAEEVQETIAHTPAVGYDVGFVSLDLTNTCRLRSLAVADGCLLILCQCTDSELPVNGRVLQAMCASLKIDD